MKFLNFLLMLSLGSCANLYKERAYVSDLEASKELSGDCGASRYQSRFTLKTSKGPVLVSMPVHYEYWWTGPLVLPLFPLTRERPDPSFVKISLKAKEGTLNRDELMKSQIHIRNMTEPVDPMTVVYTEEKGIEEFVIQFDSPKLVDLNEFRLQLGGKMTKEMIPFHLARTRHYVPIVPVVSSGCVTD